MNNKAPQQCNLSELITRCHIETQQQNDQGCCYEIFRRALENNDADAWQAIHTQYQKLVNHWIRKSLPSSLEQILIEDLQQATWEKFWKYLSKTPPLFSEKFVHIGAVLKYLNKCTITACLEWRRQQNAQERLHYHLQMNIKDSRLTDVIQSRVQELDTAKKLQDVQTWLDTNLVDKTEKLVFKLSYQHNLKPTEIVRQFPHIIPTERDVYRIKQRLLKRARRALLP
ncbi:MAG: sigma-70 family RNA polymerase sigma factor [Chloroflexi bacterium]|nr:MAG: sigma-70 family RNA polymerase sigma factor [Chloroflexota bacterium]